MAIRYHKYVPNLWDDLDLEELMGELSDFLLESGFGYEPSEWQEDNQDALREAILEALVRRGLPSDEDLQRLMGDADALEQLLQKVVERLTQEGFLRASEGQAFNDTSDLQQRMADQGARHDQLVTDLQILQGRLEENNYHIKELAQKLDDTTYKLTELDARLVQLESRQSLPTGTAAAGGSRGEKARNQGAESLRSVSAGEDGL